MRVFHDPRSLGHEVPPGFPEKPERLRALLAGFAGDARFRLETADAPDDTATQAAIERVHDTRYVERFRRAAERGDGLIDTPDNPISRASFGAALGASRAALGALAAAAAGERAFAAVRPPGHHAERSAAMGFCFFNHAAVAAESARVELGAARVAIVDIDVHHGNGSQHIFERRADVFYASLHQFPFYPGTGAAGERGIGAGEGFSVNAPLPAGSGDAEWLAALREVLLPALDRFAPELLVVSAGFDAWRADPLGGLRVTEAGFAAAGCDLAELAARHCGGRELVVLEGGYDVVALPRLAKSFLTGEAAAS